MRAFIEGKKIARPALSQEVRPQSISEQAQPKLMQQPLRNNTKSQPTNPYLSKTKLSHPKADNDKPKIASNPPHSNDLPLENCIPNQPHGILEHQEPLTAPGISTLQQIERVPLAQLRDMDLTAAANKPATTQVRPTSARIRLAIGNKADPFVLAAQRPQTYQAGPVSLDVVAAQQWIYPVHPDYPIRDYQLEISQTAIQYNTLVSLPTGLGKTLIAAVVLYNFYRWFPQGGKVVFLAPTLPLVDQQVKACYQITGIPAQDTAVLNGKVPASTRESLWQDRRVFFCTPQTVEKDIEAGRCPASQVVCLVLDEAHKAMGNFAYTKVVELCEAAGAHFRILGLSATPGAKVQQVQKVIDALRITRLEARSEEEVKEYIHERHNEIVVVKKRSVCHDIEQKFNTLIEPIMTKLRANTNIRQKIGPTDYTLTSYCIHRARQHHHQTTSDHRFDGYFIAAQKLIDARSNLFSHGIGSVRGKLLELLNTPQRGVLASVVKSPEFQSIVDAVIAASSGKHSQETAEDKKGNNPKLLKLDEILREHFLRADASGHTTRAIVFSQWRDSVSEIVDVLSLSQPLIRPRHFVGQSSGSGNKVGSMKGMPQKIQQQVIRDFQEGTFNVLVCTCIGEEGLDIGEVDLIVNYDTLRSPIRMIQRVGRTGRKRDGRVVCLISEGQEQKDMIRSKNNEKSLQRALRRSDNFKLRPNRLMFPQAPTLVKKTMRVTEVLRLSQVGGHAGPVRKKEIHAESVDNWKLSGQKESIRFQTFGPIACIHQSSACFPVSLKRALLRARARSYFATKGSNYYAHKVHAGTLRRLLLTVEAITEVKEQVSSVRKNRVVEKDSVGLFPIENSKNSAMNVIVKNGWDQRVPLPSIALIKPVVAMPPTNMQGFDVNSPLRDDAGMQNAGSFQCALPIDVCSNLESTHNVNPPGRNDPVITSDEALDFKLPTPPVSSSESECDESDDEEGVSAFRNKLIAISGESIAPVVDIRLPTPPASSSESEDEESVRETNEESHQNSNIEKTPFVTSAQVLKLNSAQAQSKAHELVLEEVQQFSEASLDHRHSPEQVLLLPTQDSSSSDDSSCADTDDRLDSEKSETQKFPNPDATDNKTRSRICGQRNIAAQGEVDVSLEHAFSHHEGSHASLLLHHNSAAQPTISTDVLSPKTSFAADAMYSPHSLTGNVNRSILGGNSNSQLETTPKDSDEVGYVFSCSDDSPELISHKTRALSRRNVIMTQDVDHARSSPSSLAPTGEELTDTQSVNQELENTRSRNLVSNAPFTRRMETPVATKLAGETGTISDSLVDTPLEEARLGETQNEDASDIFCAVCYCGDSSDADPIVLCDGVQSKSCDIAVHASCYLLEKSIISCLDEWRCDLCEATNTKKSDAYAVDAKCFICQLPGGALKRSFGVSSIPWTHPYCMTWSDEDPAIICDFCSFPGATSCSFASCSKAAHPHCVRALTGDNCWLTVVDTNEKRSAMFCWQHRHEEHSKFRFLPVDEETRVPTCFVLPSCRVERLNSSMLAKRQSPSSNCRPTRKRLKKMSNTRDHKTTKDPTDENVSTPTECDRRQRIRQNLAKRHRGMVNSAFIDTEADIDSDEDIEGDDEEASELRRIDEEEELAALDFINDSSQLGAYTQDALDRIDQDTFEEQSVSLHRRMDIENERKLQFATPILNRRMNRKRINGSDHDAWDESQNSGASRSSVKGLGNCHFIRSVIEHARRGGNADDIEAVYNEMEQEVALQEEEEREEGSQPFACVGPLVVEYLPSDEETDSGINGDGNSPPDSSGAVGLTVEQKAIIERKRLEALARRKG